MAPATPQSAPRSAPQVGEFLRRVDPQLALIRSGVMQRIARTDLLGMPFAASIFGPGASSTPCRVFLEEFTSQDHKQLLPLLERLSTTGYYDRLGEITVPTVVICGEQDRTTPRWHSETMGRDIPGASITWVPDAGHMLNWQTPRDHTGAPPRLSRVTTELARGHGPSNRD